MRLWRYHRMSSPTYSMAWYANFSVTDRKNLQRVIKTAQKKPTGCPLTSRGHSLCFRRAKKIAADSFHPRQQMFKYRCLKSRTAKLRNRFFLFFYLGHQRTLSPEDLVNFSHHSYLSCSG